MKPTTIAEAWREYVTAIYPNGISALQNRECHQAFMAGALNMELLIRQFAEMPEDEAVLKLEALQKELTDYGIARRSELLSRLGKG